MNPLNCWSVIVIYLMSSVCTRGAFAVQRAARRNRSLIRQPACSLRHTPMPDGVCMLAAQPVPRSAPRLREAGFSLVEVAIVTAIVLLIAILGIPSIGTYVIENKVPKVGEALQRFVLRTQVNAQGAGATPYAGIDNDTLAHALRDSPVFELSDQGASKRIAHGLARAADGGTVTLAPVALSGAGLGSGFAITLERVSHAACPALASVMQGVSSLIRVQSSKGGVTVKDDGARPALRYNAARTAAACSEGDVNTFTFVAR